MNGTTPSGRFRFGIRDVLWVTLVVALILGWWVDHRRLAAELGATAEVSGTVTVDGRPLAAGRIILRHRGGQFVGCAIKDGRFQIPRVAVGMWSVAIEEDGVPALYGADSSLSVEIRADSHEFEFGLLGEKALRARQGGTGSSNP